MGQLMNTPKHIVSILLVASWCLTTPVLAAPDTQCGERVPLDRLIAKPDKYHGKALWVTAHITIDFENMTACPSKNETQMESCLWLDIVDGPYKTEQEYTRYETRLQKWKQFDRQTVAIHATFDKGKKGHFSMWPGSLKQVTEVSGRKESWSFATNAAVQRNCLTGK
jgi:hypothetical protein